MIKLMVLFMAGVGIAAFAKNILISLETLKEWFDEWRLRECKFKVLCKPHMYNINAILGGRIMYIECAKCKKRERIILNEGIILEWRKKAIQND